MPTNPFDQQDPAADPMQQDPMMQPDQMPIDPAMQPEVQNPAEIGTGLTSQMVPEEVPEENPANEEPDIDRDELAGMLWDVIKKFEREDEWAHRIYFNEAIRSEHYWNNRQHVYRHFLSDNAFEWKIDEDDESQDYFVNSYRANGESIIAAMSVAEPTLNFYPDDADNSNDIVAANAYRRIATLIQKHNKSRTLMARILFILYNQSFVAVWNYNKKNKKYGTYKVPQFGQVNKTTNQEVCPTCQNPMEGPGTCPVCGSDVQQPQVVQTQETFTDIVGETDEPKTREILRAFGPLNVKIAPYIQEQEHTPYLELEFEAHPSIGKSEFPKFKNEIGRPTFSSSEYERDYRSEIYRGDYDHLDTWKCIWLRPSVYEMLEEGDKFYDFLKTGYPDGLYLIFINGTLVHIDNEDLDDHWTININPLSTFVNAESLGKAHLPINDAENELLNLSVDTVKHGIPQTIADPAIIDFEAYKNSEIAPGMIWPAKIPLGSGDSLANHILTTRTATLSQEVKDLRQDLQQKGQLVTGAFPSIYGGVVAGSRTASEYAQSRAQALQRLTITWNTVKQLWADVMSKSCTSYARNLQYDDKYVQKNGDSYINIWIRQSELHGKVGSIEPEIDEQLPTSWAQQRDVLMRLLELNSPLINNVLMSHENAYIVKEALGFKEIIIPGYESRVKQLAEIQEMMNGVQIQIDPYLDDHGDEAETCRLFLVGEIGRDLKNTNPQVYQLIYMHFVQHAQKAAENAAKQQQQEQQNQNGNKNPEQAKGVNNA